MDNNNKGNIEKLTTKNKNFRKVINSGKDLQLVLMSLKPTESIGSEIHKTDQFFRIEKGKCKVELNDVIFNLKENDYLFVPSGSRHNIINTSKTDELKLYTIYGKPLHKTDCVQKLKEDVEC